MRTVVKGLAAFLVLTTLQLGVFALACVVSAYWTRARRSLEVETPRHPYPAMQKPLLLDSPMYLKPSMPILARPTEKNGPR
jgi:hypothetical protein